MTPEDTFDTVTCDLWELYDRELCSGCSDDRKTCKKSGAEKFAEGFKKATDNLLPILIGVISAIVVTIVILGVCCYCKYKKRKGKSTKTKKNKVNKAHA